MNTHGQTPMPRGFKTFSSSTQLRMKSIMLINVKMPTTIVGILTIISRINTAAQSVNTSNGFIFQQNLFNEQLKFHGQLF